jgi:hypothetical protein
MTQLITAMTLVDITNSHVSQARLSNTIEYHQQQNLNVLLQTIGLRTQPLEPLVTIYQGIPLKDLNFGRFYGDEPQTFWSLKFYLEHSQVWDDGQDEFALLKQDAHGVAITSDLENTVEFPVNIFDTLDNVNLYFIS